VALVVGDGVGLWVSIDGGYCLTLINRHQDASRIVVVEWLRYNGFDFRQLLKLQLQQPNLLLDHEQFLLALHYFLSNSV
jgi:hypothetical protein